MFRAKASWQHKFESRSDPINVPSFSSAWETDFESIPNVSQKMFHTYATMKKEASAGQQEKAIHMLQKRKCFQSNVLSMLTLT